MSTAYVRTDDFEGLRSTINVIQNCKTYVDKNCLNGALLFGDLNARHTYWGDKSCNLLEEELVQIADHFSILNDGEPTFLAANGYSVIDLCICYGPLFDRCKHSLSTDEFAELFTGAPQRGHVPVIMRWASCGGLDVKGPPILSKFASVHWYCSKCVDKHLQGRSSNVWKSLNAINQQQKKRLKYEKRSYKVWNP